jgi:RecA/RadA recombinase
MAKKKKKAPSGNGKKRPARKARRNPKAAVEDGSDDDLFGVGGPPEPSKPTATSKKKTTKKKARKKRSARKAPERKPSPGSGEVTTAHGARPVVSLDQRNLTKKQTSKLEVWHGANHGRELDHFLRGQIAQARKQFGHRAVMVGSELDNLVIVIPCPSLAFEYLIVQDGFPLGLVIHLNGPPGAGKTSLTFEFIRWFRAAGGTGMYTDNETKMSPDLADSIIGWDTWEAGFGTFRSESVEEWQDMLSASVQNVQKSLQGTKEAPGPGRTIPFLWAIDTIMSKSAYENQEKVWKDDGHAGRAFPVEAQAITKYMRTIPQKLDGWPFALLLNNQLKLGKDDRGHEVGTTAGGQGVNFQESWNLEIRKTKRKIQCADWEGEQFRIKCTKNSFGATWREIECRKLWWEEQDPNTGAWRQVTRFDWDWATIKMLSTLKGRAAAKLKAAEFHLATPRTSDVENCAWSRNLGMKKAEDALPWSEVGAMIRKDTELMELLRDALSIKRRPLLDGDYLQQLDEMRKDLP